jgi:hypothetical protein
MAKNSQHHLSHSERVASSKSHLVGVATGTLSLWFVGVRMSCGDPHKEHQSFAGWPPGGGEFNCLASCYHYAGFSVSISGLRDRADRPSATLCPAKAVTGSVRINRVGFSLSRWDHRQEEVARSKQPRARRSIHSGWRSRVAEASNVADAVNFRFSSSGNIGRLKHSAASFSATGKSPGFTERFQILCRIEIEATDVAIAACSSSFVFGVKRSIRSAWAHTKVKLIPA